MREAGRAEGVMPPGLLPGSASSHESGPSERRDQEGI